MSMWPSFKEERALQAKGFVAVAGVDEAGSGALAGPVVCGAVVLRPGGQMPGVRDSKLLTAKARASLYEEVWGRAAAVAVGQASVEEIDALNIRQATLLAMRRAVEGLACVDYVLVDAWKIPGLMQPQHGIIHGDRQVKCIAAASIIAKVTRDRLMEELSVKYPVYGFEIHKGYGTESHRQQLLSHGPCPAHRQSFHLGGFLAKLPLN